jgi:hypothetical protein
LIDYLATIAPRIPFYRCVVDVAVNRAGGFVLVEFNSWESNSGAHCFSWADDDALLYDTAGRRIVCRWLADRVDAATVASAADAEDAAGECYYEWPLASTLPQLVSGSDCDFSLERLTVLRPIAPSNWLVKGETLFVTTDVWLAALRLPLSERWQETARWRRGPFRFDVLRATEYGLCAGDRYYWDDLSPSKPQPLLLGDTPGGITASDPRNSSEYPEPPPLKYGFVAMDERGRFVFVRFLGDRMLYQEFGNTNRRQ